MFPDLVKFNPLKWNYTHLIRIWIFRRPHWWNFCNSMDSHSRITITKTSEIPKKRWRRRRKVSYAYIWIWFLLIVGRRTEDFLHWCKPPLLLLLPHPSPPIPIQLSANKHPVSPLLWFSDSETSDRLQNSECPALKTHKPERQIPLPRDLSIEEEQFTCHWINWKMWIWKKIMIYKWQFFFLKLL